MNKTTRIIRSEEITIDAHIFTVLAGGRNPGEIYFAAIAPDMELTVVKEEEMFNILPCFDGDDAYINLPGTSLLLVYNPAQVLKLAGKRHLTGPAVLMRMNMPTVLVFFFAYFYLLSLIKHCLFTFFNIT